MQRRLTVLDQGVGGLRRLIPALVLTLAVGSALGCKAVEKARAQRSCDQDRLAALATELGDNEPDARVMIVSEGLLEACGDELYPTARSILTWIAKPETDAPLPGEGQDPAYRGAIERICPARGQIGEIMGEVSSGERGLAIAKLCGFERYGLLDDDELRDLGGHALFVWATHDFLLESGTPVEVANSISRALFRVHDVVFASVLLRPPPNLELIPIPAAAPLRPGPVIYVSHVEMLFNEQQIASLERGRLEGSAVQGHVIMPLFEVLEEETEKAAAVRSAQGDDAGELGLVLVVGAGVTFATVVDTMYTAGRLEYEHFDFAVESVHPVKRAIHVDLPPFDDGSLPEHIPGEEPPPPPPGPPSFKVLVLDDGYRVFWARGESVDLPKLEPKGRGPEAWDRARLAELVREGASADPQLREGVLSAETGIMMDVVLATYATMLGPDCKQHEDGAGCLLPQLVLEAGAG